MDGELSPPALPAHRRKASAGPFSTGSDTVFAPSSNEGARPATCVPPRFENKDTDGYVNAWYPALACDGTGHVRAAWNQHYPAILGVCAGDLEQSASTVTRLAGALWKQEERGGYPATVIDSRGRQWVLWETFGWDVIGGTPQAIRASYFDAEKNCWTPPSTLSDKQGTVLNQTPRVACDQDGVLWVVWSGRENAHDLEQPWGVYLSRLDDEKWSRPIRVSETEENARAPDIVVDGKNQVWVVWHAGIGDAMKLKVLRFRRESIEQRQ